MIAGLAAGSDEGYIYVRAEHLPGGVPAENRHRKALAGAGPAGGTTFWAAASILTSMQPRRRRLCSAARAAP